MNLILSAICCFMCIVGIFNLKFEKFEGHFSQKYFHNATGMDILRILNIDEVKNDSKGLNKYEEADILKRKMKNSDIKNFEKHLNNYLNFIRKYNKDIHYFNSNKDYSTNPVLDNEEENLIDRKTSNEKDDRNIKIKKHQEIGKSKQNTSRDYQKKNNFTHNKNYSQNEVHIMDKEVQSIISQSKMKHEKTQKENSKKINANIIINFPQVYDALNETVEEKKIGNNPEYLEDNSKNKDKKIEFKFKNISITQKIAESANKTGNKQSPITNRNNNDVFMIETANEIENNRVKKLTKNQTKHKKSLKKANSTFSANESTKNQSVSILDNAKIFNRTDKSLNDSVNKEHKDSKKNEKNNVTNISHKNFTLSKEIINEKDLDHSLIPIYNETNKSILEENKNITTDDLVYSFNEFTDSLTNKINSFFLNYGNGYNNIDIPLYNFGFQKAIPQEFLTHINKTNFDYEFFYKNKANFYSILNEIGSEKFNSLYDEINEDSDFNNFIKEEYKNIHLDKPKIQAVKVSNLTGSFLKEEKNQSIRLQQKKANLTKENIKQNGNISTLNKNNSSGLPKQKSKKIKSPNKVDPSALSITKENKTCKNKTQENLLNNKKNYMKFPKNFSSSDNKTYSERNLFSNYSKNASLSKFENGLLINSTSESLSNTIHFNKYKEDLKKIQDQEKIIKTDTSIDTKDSLFKKIQISREQKLKNLNNTRNVSNNNNISILIQAKTESKKDIKKESIVSNTTLKSQNKTSTINHFEKERNQTIKMKQSLSLNVSSSSINDSLIMNRPKVQKPISNEKSKANLRRNLLVKKTEREEFKENPENVSLPITQSLDQIYMKLKMQELNDDFERRQKMLELDKKISNIEAEYTEPNVYRKIITISISLIVTGLLLGVLLGLILVMYLNSKK